METLKQIKQLTFEKACKIEGLDPKKVIPSFPLFPKRDQKSMEAHGKVVIMIKAANRLANNGKEWIPDFDDKSQVKYELWFVKGSSGFRFNASAAWRTYSYVGSRLCFLSYDVMKAMVENKHYMKVYNEYAL